MNDLHEWFQKNDLCPENILYLYRNDRKTVVHRMDGEEAALYAPLHSVLSVLPEDRFLNISKGIAVCRSQIVNISNDGVYTMSDGRTFQERKRGMRDHRRLRAEIGVADTQPHSMNMSLLEKCSLLDDMPLAFCVIELVFNEDGHGVDFSSATATQKWQISRVCQWKKCWIALFTRCSPMAIKSGWYRMQMWR